MPGFTDKPIVIDGKAHLLGRLAAVVAKNLLHGQKIVVVRCEAIDISGGIHRNKYKYLQFMRKRCNINPRRGPFHHRAPSKIFYRTVRGMIPYKSTRGAMALKRLRVFEGIPAPYDKKKRMVVPAALRAIRLDPQRSHCSVGELSHVVGWKYQNIVATLEARRKAKSNKYYVQKKGDAQLFKTAKIDVAKHIAGYEKIIANYGKVE